MLALLLLCLAGTLLVAVGMPVLLWALASETLRERAARTEPAPRLACSSARGDFDLGGCAAA